MDSAPGPTRTCVVAAAGGGAKVGAGGWTGAAEAAEPPKGSCPESAKGRGGPCLLTAEAEDEPPAPEVRSSSGGAPSHTARAKGGQGGAGRLASAHAKQEGLSVVSLTMWQVWAEVDVRAAGARKSLLGVSSVLAARPTRAT